jgi:hypothetical protein
MLVIKKFELEKNTIGWYDLVEVDKEKNMTEGSQLNKIQ